MSSALYLDFKYEATGQNVSQNINPVFPRQDTVLVVGTISGNVTLTSITTTLKMILPNGLTGATVATRTSTGASTTGIDIININAQVKKVYLQIAMPVDTQSYDPGQQFVFDIQVEASSTFTIGTSTTSAIQLVESVKGMFTISEDYTTTL